MKNGGTPGKSSPMRKIVPMQDTIELTTASPNKPRRPENKVGPEPQNTPGSVSINVGDGDQRGRLLAASGPPQSAFGEPKESAATVRVLHNTRPNVLHRPSTRCPAQQ